MKRLETLAATLPKWHLQYNYNASILIVKSAIDPLCEFLSHTPAIILTTDCGILWTCTLTKIQLI